MISCLLRDLERLADKWSNTEHAEDLRLVVAAYLEPGLKVKYVYASEWRTGTLLTRPRESNPCWQIKRSGYGGYVDQVAPGPNTIRINVDKEE